MSVLLCAGMAAVPLLCLRSASAPAARAVVAGPTAAGPASRQFGALVSRSYPPFRDTPEPATTTTTPPPPPPPSRAARTTRTTRPRPAPTRRKLAAARVTPVTARPAPPTTAAPPPPAPPPAHQQTGQASWYDGADGACAFNGAPMGTILRVTNLANGRTTTCRIASRGPFNGRMLDMTRSTFARIASTSQGVIRVRVEW